MQSDIVRISLNLAYLTESEARAFRFDKMAYGTVKARRTSVGKKDGPPSEPPTEPMPVNQDYNYVNNTGGLIEMNQTDAYPQISEQQPILYPDQQYQNAYPNQQQQPPPGYYPNQM